MSSDLIVKAGSAKQKVQSWCHTRGELVEVEFNWSIENFSLKPESSIKSTEFPDEANLKNKWYLQIWPRGFHKALTGLIGLCLASSSKTPITASYKLTLMNSRQKILLEHGPQDVEFSSSLGFDHLVGGEKLISRQDLFKPENNFFPDDLLCFKCELRYDVKETTISVSSSPLEQAIPSSTGHLNAHFQQLLDSKSLSDITIDVQGQQFKAHKVVLAARSPVFHAMFTTDLMEKKTNIIEIRDIESSTFLELLRFIYTDQVDNLEDVASDLLAAADKYMLELLKAKCEASLSRHINLDNCGNLLTLAHLYSTPGLKKKLLDFARCHSSQVVGTVSWQEMLLSADAKLLRDISIAIMTNSA